jgi:hypothetical protein
MQGEGQQTEADAQSEILDDAPASRRKNLRSASFWFWGIICSMIYYWSWPLVFETLQRDSAWRKCLLVMLNLPLFVAEELRMNTWLALHWAIIIESLVYGFAIAFLIQWLKRRRMRQVPG